jgi:hypothetical protein
VHLPRSRSRWRPRRATLVLVLNQPVACGRYDAVFALDDPDVLVGAGLSCPACLAEHVRLSVDVVAGELNACCTCLTCASTWSLTLAPQQLLRLSLDPPPAADVRWSPTLPLSLLPLEIEDDPDA